MRVEQKWNSDYFESGLDTRFTAHCQVSLPAAASALLVLCRRCLVSPQLACLLSSPTLTPVQFFSLFLSPSWLV